MGKYKDWFLYDDSSKSCLRWNREICSGASGSHVNVSVGDEAGGFNKVHEYFIVRFKGRLTGVHRIIWEIFNGDIPEGFQIDHIDGVRSNNNISNLRAVEPIFNSRNHKKRVDNTSGVVGVSLSEKLGNMYWRASWQTLEGRQSTKSFSIKMFGEDALEMAIRYRSKMVELLNSAGAGYTEDHGKRL
jgi:hypothetical protein